MRQTVWGLAALVAACAGGGSGGGSSSGGGDTGGLSVGWSDGGLTLTVPAAAVGKTLRFTQGSAHVDVTASAATLRLGNDVPAGAFDTLSAGDASWAVVDDPSGPKGTLTLGERFTTFYEPQSVPGFTLTGLPTQAAVGATVAVSGTAPASGLRATAYIGEPDGPVIEITLADAPLTAGQAFAFEVAVDTPGLYAVELLQPSGGPAAVLPIYAGDVLPVLTSPLDRGLTGKKVTDLAPLTAELRERTNTLRTGMGLAALPEHATLTSMAQAKADDLAKNRRFGHQSAALGGVTDQFKAAGLTGTVIESLALDFTAERAFLGLYWSPAHRVAMVDPTWKGQGVGAAWFDEASGQIVFVQHVATVAP